MNIQLGSGKVHAADENPGHLPLPKCGGNKPAERYRKTAADVTCKACFKAVLAELEKIEAEDAESATNEPVAEPVAEPVPNVVSYNGGKVHTGMPGMGDHPYPLCRGGGQNQNLTKFRATDAPVTCKTCRGYIDGHAALAAAAEPEGDTLTTSTPEPATAEPADETRRVEPGEVHPFLLRVMAAAPDMGTLHSARIGYTGKTRHAVWEGTERTACNKPAGEPTPFDHIAPDCRTCLNRLNNLLKESADMATAKPAKKTAAKKTTAAAKPNASEVDDLITAVHVTIDELKELDPKKEGAATEAVELKQEAETKILELPTARRTTLRKAAKEAFDAKTAEVKAKDEPAPSTEVATTTGRDVAVDPRTYEGVDELIKAGAKQAREGVELGIKMGSVSGTVAQIILDMRTRIPNPNLGGLPDLMADLKTTKNAAAEIYKEASKGVDDDDIQRKDAYASLIKSVQNKNSDVLVDWLRAMDTPESWDAFAEIFPHAAEIVTNARAAKAEGDESVPDLELSPEAVIRELYANQGVTLPLKGRTQIAREQAAAKRLEAAQKELSAAKEVAADAAAAPEEREEAKAKAEKLEARVKDLEASVPEDARKAVEAPTKTHEERTTERFVAAKTLLTKVSKGAETLDTEARAKLKADMNALIADLAAEAAKL